MRPPVAVLNARESRRRKSPVGGSWPIPKVIGSEKVRRRIQLMYGYTNAWVVVILLFVDIAVGSGVCRAALPTVVVSRAVWVAVVV